MKSTPDEEIAFKDNNTFCLDIENGLKSIDKNVDLDISKNNIRFSYLSGSDDDNIDDPKNILSNPTSNKPMDISLFLKHLDISPILKTLGERYGSLDYHSRYPPEAMLKASIIKVIMCEGSFQKLVNRFISKESSATDIGFRKKDNDNNIKIPDRRTFRHWTNVRMDNETLMAIANEFIRSIRHKMEMNGMSIGKRIVIDSTPLEALQNDSESKYNTHYKKEGYKIFTAHDLDHEIPLAMLVTTMERFDGPYMFELLDNINSLGIRFREVYADGAFNGFDNFALIHNMYRAKLYTRLDKHVTKRKEGTVPEINKRYNKYWRENDFVPANNTTLENKLDYLFDKGEYTHVGAYYRNIYMNEWNLMEEFKKLRIPSKYNNRNSIEGFHGFIKQFMGVQFNFKRKGLRNTEHYVYWLLISILAIALTRLQNGITADLKQIAFFD